MSQEFIVSDGVKEYVSEIIAQHNLDPASKIEYQPGSEVGDGYLSQTIAVNIQDKEKPLNLFLKCSNPLITMEEFKTIFKIETFLYEILYPAYVNFQKKHNVQDIFQNVPKFFGATAKGSQDIIALENLKSKNYELFSRYDLYNDEHLTYILKTFAKFHAISFAFKDQERETYESWRGNLMDYDALAKGGKFEQMTGALVRDVFSKLDPVEDKDILMAFGDVMEVLNSSFKTLNMDYAIITKGDCWNNNMLFLYEDESKEKPIDIMLIDWQIMKESSPVHDLIIFVYPMSTQEMLDNMEHYLKVYHDELSFRIQELGSDPEKLYPYSAFLKEWDEIAPMVFVNVIMMLKVIVLEKDETVDIQAMTDAKEGSDIFKSIKNESVYLERVKGIARHLIKRKRMNFRKTMGIYERSSSK